MKLVKIDINKLEDIYSLDCFEKEFRKAIGEIWKQNPPFLRYQKKLLIDLAVLDDQKENAVKLPEFERLTDEIGLFSIRHPHSNINMRVIYTIEEGFVILITVFIEKNRSDYNKAIKISRKRRKWIISDAL